MGINESAEGLEKAKATSNRIALAKQLHELILRNNNRKSSLDRLQALILRYVQSLHKD